MHCSVSVAEAGLMASVVYVEQLERVLKAAWPQALAGVISTPSSRLILELEGRLFGLDRRGSSQGSG